jgi:hypothetical protein
MIPPLVRTPNWDASSLRAPVLHPDGSQRRKDTLGVTFAFAGMLPMG